MGGDPPEHLPRDLVCALRLGASEDTAHFVGRLAQEATSRATRSTVSRVADPTARRPKLRRGTKEKAWGEAPAGPSAETKSCPGCQKVLRNQKDPQTGKSDVSYDHYGSRGPWVQRQDELRKRGASRPEVRDDYQEEVRVLCPLCNSALGAKLAAERRKVSQAPTDE